MEGLWKKHKSKGFVVLAISLEDNEDALKKAAKRDKISYGLAQDKRVRVTAGNFPSDMASICYLFDRSGKCVWGGGVLEVEKAQGTLAKALAEPYRGPPIARSNDKPKLNGDSGQTTKNGGKPKTTTAKPKAAQYPHVLVLKDGTRIRGRQVGKAGNKIFFKGEDGKSKFYGEDVVEKIEK